MKPAPKELSDSSLGGWFSFENILIFQRSQSFHSAHCYVSWNCLSEMIPSKWALNSRHFRFAQYFPLITEICFHFIQNALSPKKFAHTHTHPSIQPYDIIVLFGVYSSLFSQALNSRALENTSRWNASLANDGWIITFRKTDSEQHTSTPKMCIIFHFKIVNQLPR